MSLLATIAFGLPSYGELFVIGVIGLLIFGRRLPEVGRTVGKTLVQFRRGLQDFKDQLNADESLREVRSTVHDIRKVGEAPRVLANPQRWLDDQLTDQSLSTPGPDVVETSEPPAGPFETSADAEGADGAEESDKRAAGPS